MLIGCRWFAGVLAGLWLACTALAAELPPIDHEQETYQKLYRLAADRPEQAQAEALRLYQTLDPARDTSAWLQVFTYLYANKPDVLEASLKTLERLNAFADRAEQSGFTHAALKLRYMIALETRKDLEAVDWEFLEKAERAGLARIVTQILSKQAYEAYNAGDMKTSLGLIQKAFRHLDGKVPQDDTQLLEVKGNLASFLEYSGKYQKAEDVYKTLVADYRRLKLRWALCDTLNNYALLMMHENRFRESEDNNNEILGIAKNLNAPLLEGRALKGLGFAQAEQKLYAKAVVTYKRSLAMQVQAHEDPVAIADTYKILGEALVADKQWEEALKALGRAQQDETAMKDKYWERSLQDSRAQAFAGLGRTAEALQAAFRSNELLTQTLREEKDAALSRLKVSLGLQVEEQKNNLLREQNSLQKEKLRDAEVLRRFFYGLSISCLLVIILLGVALRQTLRAKRSRERIHRILEHIDEGILSIGAGMRVEADLSPYLKRLVKGQGERKPGEDIFMRLLNEADLTSDARATIRASLQACIGEESLSWDLNAQQLPYEVSIHGGERHLRFEWQPIYNEHRIIQNVLVTVRDVTARKQLEQAVDSARAWASRLEQRLADILQIDAISAEAFVAEVRNILPDVKSRIERGEDLQPCARPLHTLKGMARTLGFHELSALVHDLEDEVAAQDATKARVILQQLEQTIQEYEEIIRKVFFRQNEAAGHQATALIDVLAQPLTAMRRQLERAGFQLAQVDVQDHIAEWPKEWLETANLVLMHGLTNSADHGYILPRRRGVSLGRQAKLRITALPTTAGGMELELCDNGFGLDFPRLEALATAAGFTPHADETIADVIFLDGITTAEQVSRSSGRGLGMAAAREAVERCAGRIRIQVNPEGQGSRLWVQLPHPLHIKASANAG